MVDQTLFLGGRDVGPQWIPACLSLVSIVRLSQFSSAGNDRAYFRHFVRASSPVNRTFTGAAHALLVTIAEDDRIAFPVRLAYMAR